MPIKTFTLAEQPDREDDFEALAEAGWPRFMRQRDAQGLGEHWPSLYTTWADYQLIVMEGLQTLAVGHSVPITWDGTPDDLPDSMAGILARADADLAQDRKPTALAALAALVAPAHRGKGVSATLLRAMRSLAATTRLTSLVAPVRPTMKDRYPLAPMARYVAWTREDGGPIDPWLRTHWRLGAETVRVIPRAMVIEGSIAEWEDWTGMRFPDTGDYVVPGALQPVRIDRERNEGRYEDPNVWMRHGLDGP
jgi:GNAT superfamily N-acetyltransferase